MKGHFGGSVVQASAVTDPVKEHIVLLPDRLDESVDDLLEHHSVSVEGKLSLTLKFCPPFR
jgi:hypothetical protein